MKKNSGPVIRISAKNLGALALQDSCARCAWLRLKLNHRLPFQIFPGIFSSIDSFTKNVVHAWFDRHGQAPSWLAKLGPLKGYRHPPHYSKFNVLVGEFEILLTGSPDGVFVRPDGSHMIADYKTARFTDVQDDLFSMYEVQLNAYALIGATCGLRPITGLALIYMEPMTNGTPQFHGQCRNFGFEMGFTAKTLRVEIRPKLLTPLFARTRELVKTPTPPKARPGCKDCELIQGLLREAV